MAAKGASLNEIQAVLGHENASTTDKYLHSLGFVAVRGAMMLLEENNISQCDLATGS
jgi:site-specific recombinase XerD